MSDDDDDRSYKSPSNYDDDDDDDYEEVEENQKSPKISELYTSEMRGDADALYRRRKKEKKALLKEVFMHENHRYRAYLSVKGIHWTRLTIKGRKHFMDYSEVIGVQLPAAGASKKNNKDASTFKIIGVSSTKQEKLGTRKPVVVSFGVLREYSDGNPDEIINKWAEMINKNAAATRSPIKKLLVLINPFSGKKEAVNIWKSVKIYLKLAGIQYKAIKTECRLHAYNLTLNLPASEYSSIICVSGDGLLNEVVNGVFARKDYRDILRDITFGVIPAGSGNGLAGSLHMPDPFSAVYGIIQGKNHPLDIFTMYQANERKYGFLNICWATMSVIDLESEGYRWLGPIRWDIKGIAEIATNYAYKGKISYIEVRSTETKLRKQQEIPMLDENYSKPALNYIDSDDPEDDNWTVIDGEWSFFIACNTTKAIIGPGELARYARLSDGCIDLILAPALGRVDLTALLLGIDDGSLLSHPAVKYIKVKAFKLEPDLSTPGRRAPISIDGEHTDNTGIAVELHPALMRIFYDPFPEKPGLDKVVLKDKDTPTDSIKRIEKSDYKSNTKSNERPAPTKTRGKSKLGTGLPISEKGSRSMKQIQMQGKPLIATSAIKPDEIEIVDTLGVGSCATVYRGFWQQTEVAIKIINSKKSTKQIETLTDEANLMVTMRHPNVVPLFGAWLSKPVLFLVTEYMARGDVYGILHNEDIEIEKKHVRSMALDTCRGMTYLHSRNIIHRDLKTLNILVDQSWHIKVADFGLARQIEDAVFAQALTACGTTSWTAPEVLREQNYTLNADVYSFAICLWEMATRQEPFADLYAPQVVLAVAVEGKRLDIPSTVPQTIADIIRECWQEDPNKRPTFASLVDRLTKVELEEPTHPTPWSKKEEAAKKQQVWQPTAIILEE